MKLIPLRKNKKVNSAGIYQIESFANDKKYIGSSIHLSNRVFGEHLCLLKHNKHYNPCLQNHFNKYGENDFWFDIIEYCHKEKGETILEYKKRILSREQFYINTLQPEFNICKIAGNRLGVKNSEETRKKMKARMNSEETRQKLSKAWKPHKISEKTKRKISKNNKRAFLGRTHTEESRIKMSGPRKNTKQIDKEK